MPPCLYITSSFLRGGVNDKSGRIVMMQPLHGYVRLNLNQRITNLDSE